GGGRACGTRKTSAAASAEPDGIPERGARSPGAGCAPERDGLFAAAASGQLQQRIRQYRRLAVCFTDRDGELSGRGAEDQPAGGGGSGDASDGEYVSLIRRAHAGRARGRVAVRNARRVGREDGCSTEWRLPVQDRTGRNAQRAGSARNYGGWRAGASSGSGRKDAAGWSGAGRPRVAKAVRDSRAVEGGAAHARRDVCAEDRGAR